MKIRVIGASGVGKSTLCKYISEVADIYWIDTDRYLWKDADFTENYPIEERLKMYQNDICSLACHRCLLKEAKCKTLELDANQPVDVLCQLVLKEFH
ncbi:hypothetical protein EDD66_102241 [Mobilisporobacter senegalensis]|uniref:Shikimate kinase n=1 Tax=Mobilisporobacter senegalensis TaxID=1329262 RepID=A0A3N1XWD3_9FIRM|nr:hypothetical protein [Mobilisporobacter senegalensis]ROR30588.1 hypothetical protein EDD66_102241 [Mobilisporobacter senegalensis]